MRRTDLFCLLVRRKLSSFPTDWDTALPFQSIPGPKSVPVAGNIWRFLPFIGDLHNLDTSQLHVELNRRFGEIVKLEGIPGKAPMIFLYNAKDVAKVFHTECSFPVRDTMQSTRYYRNTIRPEPYTRVGHLIDHGTQWKKFRSRVNQLMMKQSSIDVYREAVERVTSDLVKRFKERKTSSGTSVYLSEELKKWALEVLGVVALDHRFGCLEKNLTIEAAQIFRAVEDFHRTTYSLDTQPFPLWKYFSSSSFKQMVSALDHLHSVSEKYVLLAKKKCAKERTNSILQELIAQNEDGKDVALVLSVDMFLAGVEIISGLSAVLLYALSKYQHWQEWLAERVCARSHQHPQPYLHAFIKEALRLWPVAIGTIRTAQKDTVLSGYKIHEGSLLVVSNYVMCRNDMYFSDPLNFNPERWLKAESLDFSQFAFAPFGIGSRSCVGRRIAMLEAEVFLMQILKNFIVEYTEEEGKFDSRFLNLLKSPLDFKMVERRK